MKFPSDSYVLVSLSKNELTIVLHFCLVLSLSLLVEEQRPEQALTEGSRELIIKICKKNVAISQKRLSEYKLLILPPRPSRTGPLSAHYSLRG